MNIRCKLSRGPRRASARPAESGAAILVAMVVIAALSGLGVVALTASLSASRAAGNANLMAQGRMALQPAVVASLRLIDDINFASALTAGFRTSRSVSEGGVVLESQSPFPGALFVVGEGSSLRGTVFGDPAVATSLPSGDATRDVNLRFRQQWPPVPVAGFEVGTFCRERIRVEGTVVVGSRGSTQMAVPQGGAGGDDPDPDPAPPGYLAGTEVAAQNASRFSMLVFSPPVACEGY